MVTEWLLAGAGLGVLLVAGDALVKGAVNLSLRLGIPALIVSLTVVAFGTSAPELLISISAVLADTPGIALGNVVGSNIANILLVLGLPALVAGFATGACHPRQTYLLMMGVSVAFTALCFFGTLGWRIGLLLLAGLAVFLWGQFRDARAHRAGLVALSPDELEGADPSLPTWRIAVYLLVGLAGLPIGANLLVDSGVAIARNFGIPETVIGLTLIAVGTSLPELATTLMAALRNNASVALGNVIGSNIFNLLAIIGVASLFGDIPVDPTFLRTDLWVMLASGLVLAPFVFSNRDMGRPVGFALTALYAAYILWLVL